MLFQSFGQRDDSRRQSLCGVRLVPGNVSPYLLQPRTCQRRPDNLYRHRASSSCCRPQAHLGGGISRSVPQESSQAFMSSCLT